VDRGLADPGAARCAGGIFSKALITADDVKKVVVRIASDEANTVSNRDMPDICVGAHDCGDAAGQTATFRSAHDKERMKDPAVLKQRAKVEVVADPRYDARASEARSDCRGAVH